MSKQVTLVVAVVLGLLGAAVIFLGEFEVLPGGAITSGIGGGTAGLGVALFMQQRRRGAADAGTHDAED